MSAKDAQEAIQRGDYRPSPAGTATVIGLRAADVYMQYAIFRYGLGSTIIRKLGGTVLAPGPPALTNTPLDALGLSPYRLILMSMATTTAVRHVYWIAVTSMERMPVSTAVMISTFSFVTDTLNALLFINRATSASANGESFPQTPLLVGVGLFAAGILIEAGSETQRYFFKKDPNNKGKLYTGGLFGVARHINYMGFTLWRAGIATASGGFAWGVATFAFHFYQFTHAIPALSKYCKGKYGEQWTQYTSQTPYRMIPGIY